MEIDLGEKVIGNRQLRAVRGDLGKVRFGERVAGVKKLSDSDMVTGKWKERRPLLW